MVFNSFSPQFVHITRITLSQVMNPALALDIFIEMDDCQSSPDNLDLSVGLL